ncbi:MAG: Kae1-associated serine/threonine protein kinase [Candidatus Lokiarchaeota archaeon]|nr:Kae1-associated serine/threonine protein kinase [Candidatus Lokiarchaeota archaeon]
MEGYLVVPWDVLALGAESTIFHGYWSNKEVILKVRPCKSYLITPIDRMLRISRTVRESRMLTFARTLGVPTPSVYWIDVQTSSILMDFIRGESLKNLVESLTNEKLAQLCKTFGYLLAELHKGDTIHGDPTTSNVILDEFDKMWLIDFGLSERNATIEMKGTDLHLVNRAIETTHWKHQEIMNQSILDGYSSNYGSDSNLIIARMNAIRERGRYH